MNENRVKISRPQLKLLEKLSNAVGVSGNEDEVRQIVIEEIRPLVDECQVDRMGNLLAIKHAKTAGAARVMFAAHMDEVGFMLVQADTEGCYAFEAVGGIDERQLLAKPVLVGKDHLPGVIGSKPVHLTSPAERAKSPRWVNCELISAQAALAKQVSVITLLSPRASGAVATASLAKRWMTAWA